MRLSRIAILVGAALNLGGCAAFIALPLVAQIPIATAISGAVVTVATFGLNAVHDCHQDNDCPAWVPLTMDPIPNPPEKPKPMAKVVKAQPAPEVAPYTPPPPVTFAPEQPPAAPSGDVAKTTPQPEEPAATSNDWEGYLLLIALFVLAVIGWGMNADKKPPIKHKPHRK